MAQSLFNGFSFLKPVAPDWTGSPVVVGLFDAIDLGPLFRLATDVTEVILCVASHW